MSVTININGDLILDQTAGLQDDDVEVGVTGGTLDGSLDGDFLAYLNTLTLTDAQKAFAANVEGASDPDLVTITATANETIGKLFFSDAAGNDFDGDQVPGLTTIDGQSLFMWTALNGKAVLVTTGSATDSVVAAFYIEPTNDAHTTAVVQSITFVALTHPDPNNPDDQVDFSDVLRVSAVITTPIGDDIIVEDDGPTIVTSTDSVQLTVDETDLDIDDSAGFAGEFTSDFGTDGPGGITYELDTVAGPSGLVDTVSGQNVILSETGGGSIEGRTELDGDLVFTVSVDGNTGEVSLDQDRAVRHDPELGPDQSTTLADDSLVTLLATITDEDDDSQQAVLGIGQNLHFEDDSPTIVAAGTPPTVTVDESDLNVTATQNFAGLFFPDPGNDGLAAAGITFELAVGPGLTQLVDTQTGQQVGLQAVGGAVEARNSDGDLCFRITVDGLGNVTLDQSRAVGHADPNNPNDNVSLPLASLVTLTATIEDGDADTDSDTIGIGTSFVFTDDAPVITVPSSAGTPATAAPLGNAAGEEATGTIGWDVGNDGLDYANGESDFVLPINLAGSVELTGAILNPVVTLVSESATSALFNFTFNFDNDPNLAGVQLGTAAGTLAFNKSADTFAVTLTDPVEGFSFSVLHTSELLRKAPPGNTGHPELVVSELQDEQPPPLSDGFYVQFTANGLNNNNPTFGFNATGDGPQVPGDTTYNNGQFVSNNFEDWVSATQSTNGVAGDTIQKGELLTLRFFGENILGDVDPGAPGGGTEKVNPTTTADGVAIKFDGIGNAEDLVVLLDLINADGVETTRAINVQNADFIKGVVPAPYNTEFSLDNNDALLVMEANDYNAAGETFQVQGIQIMQSANGLTGQAINLNGQVGPTGGSNATGGLTAWDPLDNDVLKITDIGFIQTTTGFQDAALDFSFVINDGDADTTPVQHIHVNISNDFI